MRRQSEMDMAAWLELEEAGLLREDQAGGGWETLPTSTDAETRVMSAGRLGRSRGRGGEM